MTKDNFTEPVDLAFIDPKNIYGTHLGLDIKDPVCDAFNHAFFSNKHLIEKGKKTTALKYEQKFDQITQQALKLSEAIECLEDNFRNCLMYSLSGEHDISITNNKQINYFIESLAKASQSVKAVKLKPIPTGFYNTFLFNGIDSLLSSRSIYINFSAHLSSKRIEPTEEIAKKYLSAFWKDNDYTRRTKEVAVKIIMSHLSATSTDPRTAEKAVDKHLPTILEERINCKASLLVKSYHRLMKSP